MKILKILAIFLLLAPLYLKAEEPESKEQETVAQEENFTNTNLEGETEDTTPTVSTPRVSSLEQGMTTIKNFDNSVEGSKEFINHILSSVYSELPKKKDNNEIFDYLALITSENFAFTYMSKWVVGREVLKDATEEEQGQYLKISKEYMILLYGEIFDTYYKQYTYKISEVERKSDSQYNIKMKVESKVQDARNQDAILNILWKVKYSEKENRFYVIDIDINGIVFLNTQKKQFQDMLTSVGNNFPKFLELLDLKNTESKNRLGITDLIIN